THTHTWTHTHNHRNSHTHTGKRTQSHNLTHLDTHTQSQKLSHTHTHTHTHTQSHFFCYVSDVPLIVAYCSLIRILHYCTQHSSPFIITIIIFSSPLLSSSILSFSFISSV